MEQEIRLPHPNALKNCLKHPEIHGQRVSGYPDSLIDLIAKRARVLHPITYATSKDVAAEMFRAIFIGLVQGTPNQLVLVGSQAQAKFDPSHDIDIAINFNDPHDARNALFWKLISTDPNLYVHPSGNFEGVSRQFFMHHILGYATNRRPIVATTLNTDGPQFGYLGTLGVDIATRNSLPFGTSIIQIGLGHLKSGKQALPPCFDIYAPNLIVLYRDKAFRIDTMSLVQNSETSWLLSEAEKEFGPLQSAVMRLRSLKRGMQILTALNASFDMLPLTDYSWVYYLLSAIRNLDSPDSRVCSGALASDELRETLLPVVWPMAYAILSFIRQHNEVIDCRSPIALIMSDLVERILCANRHLHPSQANKIVRRINEDSLSLPLNLLVAPLSVQEKIIYINNLIEQHLANSKTKKSDKPNPKKRTRWDTNFKTEIPRR